MYRGEVVSNDVAYGSGFDLGRLTLRTAQGMLTLGVYNELMTATLDGERIATFPDLLASIDPITGEPVSISELVLGVEATIIVADRGRIPLGAGVFDPAAYPDVEKAMGEELVRYAINH